MKSRETDKAFKNIKGCVSCVLADDICMVVHQCCCYRNLLQIHCLSTLNTCWRYIRWIYTCILRAGYFWLDHPEQLLKPDVHSLWMTLCSGGNNEVYCKSNFHHSESLLNKWLIILYICFMNMYCTNFQCTKRIDKYICALGYYWVWQLGWDQLHIK